jgi:diaminopimelate epimerase
MRFAKLQGSGNDFVVIDNRDGKVEEFLRSLNIDIKEFVKRVCAFHTGSWGGWANTYRESRESGEPL